MPNTAHSLPDVEDGNARQGEQPFASGFPGFEFPTRDGRRLRVNRFQSEQTRERIWLRLYDGRSTRRARATIALERDQARDVAAAIDELLGRCV